MRVPFRVRKNTIEAALLEFLTVIVSSAILLAEIIRKYKLPIDYML